MQSNSDNPIERRSAKQQQSMGFPPPQRNEPLPCPRCDSTTTKFCYYNNYNLSQPRYFCKSCRRYWTHGGTLRNVPVGGGTRKISKKSRTASASSPSSSSSSPSVSVASQSTPENLVFAINNFKVPQMESRDMNQKENAALLSLNLEGSLGISGYDLSSGFDGMGFGLSAGFEGLPELSGSGGSLVGPSSEYNTWQLSGGDGDCLGWSKLDDPGKNFE